MTMKKKQESLSTQPSLKTPDGVNKNLAQDFVRGANSERQEKGEYSWDAPHLKTNSYKKQMRLEIPEALKLRLDFIAENTPHSRVGFILSHMEEIIIKKSDLLIKKGHRPKNK